MKQIITRLIDDLDEGDAEETVRFGLDGVQYEIDLSAKNAAKLRDVLAEYVASGRLAAGQAHGRVHRVSGRSTNGATDKALNRRVREWARAAGREVADRGRVSGELVNAFRAEQSGTPAIRAAAAAVHPPGDGLDQMRVADLRRLAADRGWSTLTRASKPAIVATMRANPDGPPAASKTEPVKAAKPKASAPDMSAFTLPQKRELFRTVRAWAAAHGVTLTARKAIPDRVWAAYDASDPALMTG